MLVESNIAPKSQEQNVGWHGWGRRKQQRVGQRVQSLSYVCSVERLRFLPTLLVLGRVL